MPIFGKNHVKKCYNFLFQRGVRPAKVLENPKMARHKKRLPTPVLEECQVLKCLYYVCTFSIRN